MRAVFTVPEAVEGDARYTVAGPGRLHLNACVCGRIENFAGRMSGSVGCAGETSAKLPRGWVGNRVSVGDEQKQKRGSRRPKSER